MARIEFDGAGVPYAETGSGKTVLLRHGPVHLVGHACDAAVAQRLAAQWPERIGSLVLTKPVAFQTGGGAGGWPGGHRAGAIPQAAEPGRPSASSEAA